MPDPLARVSLAADTILAARVEYRAAIVAASEAGQRASDIARAAGVSRQAISEILGKYSRSVEAASSPTA